MNHVEGYPWSLLEALEPFFETHGAEYPEHIRALLRPLPDLQRALRRTERQVTFFGAFKAGKSSLLNAIIGAPILPVRANRATGVVTVIEYGDRPEAAVVRRTESGLVEEPLHFDSAPNIMLLDLSENASHPPRGVEEVRIRVPLPLLADRCVLVDTPGLLEHEALTERSDRELERTDLAVMVLSADKILSVREREAARHMHDVLNGNIIYVLNRMDLVEETEREEVLEWARTALQGSGNRIVGEPRIIATAAKRLSAAAGGSGLVELQDWLAGLLSGPVGDAVAILSRLGILEQHLCRISVSLEAEIAEAKRATQELRHEEAARLEREKTEIRGRIAEARSRLRACKDNLAAAGDRFVARCVAGTRPQLQSQQPATIRVHYDAALRHYASEISDEVSTATAAAPVTVPAFDLKQWIVRGDVFAASHPASELGALFGGLVTRVVDGGSAGRAAGGSIGGWIGKNVFRVDTEQETIKRVVQVARGVLPDLRAEAERYVDGIEALLAEADRFYKEWTRASPRVAEAEAVEGSHRELAKWCGEFLEKVRAQTEKILRTSFDVTLP